MLVFTETKELLQNSFRGYKLLCARLRRLAEGMYFRTSDMTKLGEMSQMGKENKCL